MGCPNCFGEFFTKGLGLFFTIIAVRIVFYMACAVIFMVGKVLYFPNH